MRKVVILTVLNRDAISYTFIQRMYLIKYFHLILMQKFHYLQYDNNYLIISTVYYYYFNFLRTLIFIQDFHQQIRKFIFVVPIKKGHHLKQQTNQIFYYLIYILIQLEEVYIMMVLYINSEYFTLNLTSLKHLFYFLNYFYHVLLKLNFLFQKHLIINNYFVQIVV